MTRHRTTDRWANVVILIVCIGLAAMVVVGTCVGCTQPVETLQVLMNGDDIERIVAITPDGEVLTLIAVERPQRVEILRCDGQRLILEGSHSD